MSYFQGGAILRGDLIGVAEEAVSSEVGFIGTRLAVPIPVATKNGQYPRLQINAGNLLRDELQRQAPGVNRSRVSRAYTTDTYDTVRWELEEPVTDEMKGALARYAWDLQASATKNLTRHALIRHERQVASAVQNASTWSVITSGTAYTELNLATFDVGLDIDRAKAALAGRGESLSNLAVAMSLDVFLRIRASTKLQNRIRGDRPGETILNLGEQAVADALGVSQVFVGNAYYDASQQGATSSSITSIWNNTYIWVGQVGGGDYFSGASIRTLHATEDLPSIFTLESYREDQTASDIVRIKTDHVVKVINANAGQLLDTQYS